MPNWKCVLQLDSQRRTTGGSPQALVDAIRRGADLRIGTEFRHNEHIDTDSDSNELIREVAEFGVTYLVDNRWAAGVMSLRQPIELPTGFGPRASMSFFLYNQDGRQAIARPHLDGKPAPPAPAQPGRSAPEAPPGMPKYHTLDSWDAGTNAPSNNFIYDFELFRYHVRDDWREAYANDAQGRPITGSLKDLTDAFGDGAAIKVAVRGLCADLQREGDASGGDASGGDAPIDHEVFVNTGSHYYYTEQKLFMLGTHPLVRIRPAVPMKYESRAWDFGWLMLRTDGNGWFRRCDPYTLAFNDVPVRLAIRWLVR